MDNEILQILDEIRIVLYLILAVVTLGILPNVISKIINAKSSLRDAKERVFKGLASDLFDEGDIDGLISYCEEQLVTKPNNSTALWWLAKAYYKNKNYSRSKELFTKAMESEPEWGKEHIKPYLEKIEEHNA